jgi:hypothetical protein
MSRQPMLLMKVDLPAPGTPEMPTRMALPVCGASSRSISRAFSRWSGLLDSTRVRARAMYIRLPASTCSTSSGTSIFIESVPP